MKVLVTGAAGFLGGHLIDMLVERGDEVRAMVRPVEDTSYLRTVPNIEIVNGDLTDPASLKRAVQGVERVYNIAAKTGPWGPEAVYRAINVKGVSDLIYASMDAGVKRIVHTSSITVYGHNLSGLVTESHPFHAEDNPYSRTKITGEKMIDSLVNDKNAPVIIVRPGWIYGPRDKASFAKYVGMVESKKLFFFGSGKNIVATVYVRDVAQGLIKAGDADDRFVGRAYNLCNDEWITQEEYLNTIAEALGMDPLLIHAPFTPLYAAGRSAELAWRALGRQNAAPPPLTTYGITLQGRDQQFSIQRAREDLGYAPEYDIKRGVAEGVKWYLEMKKGEKALVSSSK
jgi:nucleoside-diphosphate-sugar epimerase